MYPSLFFGEASAAELFTQRAEPSRALWFQKPSQNEPVFPSFVDTDIGAIILNSTILIGIIRTPTNFYINECIIGAKKLIMTRSLYLYSNSL